MKSFKQFNEDAYAGRQGAGAWLTSKALELGARGIKQGYKGIKALTSLASKKKSEKSESESESSSSSSKKEKKTKDQDDKNTILDEKNIKDIE